MGKIKDYNVKDFLKSIEVDQRYQEIKNQIEQNGSFKCHLKDNSVVKFYAPQLWKILTSEKIHAKVYSDGLEKISSNQYKPVHKEEQVEVNGYDYRDDYIKGFKNGEEDFERKYRTSANIKDVLPDIRENHLNTGHSTFNKGWNFVTKEYPIILNRRIIFEYGYYSGLVSKVEEIIKDYPSLFQREEIPVIDFGKDGSPITKVAAAEIFDYLVPEPKNDIPEGPKRKGPMNSQDKDKFIALCIGQKINGPIRWLWDADNNPGHGDQSSVKNLFYYMFKTYGRAISIVVEKAFIDQNGNLFVGGKRGTSQKIALYKDGIEEIRSKHNI